jgi:hypothetical protein
MPTMLRAIARKPMAASKKPTIDQIPLFLIMCFFEIVNAEPKR